MDDSGKSHSGIEGSSIACHTPAHQRARKLMTRFRDLACSVLLWAILGNTHRVCRNKPPNAHGSP